MKLKRLPCLLTVLLLLTGCGSNAPATPAPDPSPTPQVTATPTPTPTPKPVETPEPAPNAIEALERYLDELLTRESWDVYYWVNSGSGPSMVTLDSEAFARTLQEQLGDVSDWQPESQEEYNQRCNFDEGFDGIEISFDWPNKSNGLVLNFGPNTAVLQPMQSFYVENMDEICQALMTFCPFEY